MHQCLLVFLVFIFQLQPRTVIAQKAFSEGTVVYNISVQPKDASKKNASVLNGAKAVLYLKGGLSKTELTSSLGTETTIYNGKTGNAVILREYSGQKLMITLTKDNWDEKNKKYRGLTFEITPETKIIEGYQCKKAIGKLVDGSTITVFYTPEITLINKEYNMAFKELAGLPLEYEFETETMKFKYSVAEIDFNPISTTKFEFPKTGFRVMTYEDNKQVKKEG